MLVVRQVSSHCMIVIWIRQSADVVAVVTSEARPVLMSAVVAS